MTYQYKMAQVPSTIPVRASQEQGGEAAAFLEEIVNRFAQEGWEFYRMDSVGVYSQPGCLMSLFGHKEELTIYYVVTFRKLI